MAKLRKFFTISVMAITVLSMSIVVAPEVQASASAGDLIKTDAYSTVYYLGEDGRRYGFPNEATFFSWYSDFSGVMTIPQSELESYRVAGMITMRPGTKLVKIQSDPRVYAVEPGGALRWIESEDAAKALYGEETWNQIIVDVPDAFIGNYTVNGKAYGASTDADIEATALDGSEYPDGAIVQWEGSADIYYIEDGKARKFASEAAMSANRYRMSDVVTATSVAMPALGADIVNAIADLINPALGSSAEGTQPDGASGLSVALAAGTPASQAIIADSTGNEYPQAFIPFTTVNFTASSDGDATVKTLKFNRIGIASDSDLGNLYLYDGDTQIAEYNSFSDKVVTFSNSSGLFTVSAGATKSITLRGDLARGSSSVSSGKTIGFKVDSAANVVTNGATVSGSFPLSGNLMSTASVSDLGHLYFSNYANTHPSTVKADEADKQLWTMSATADAQDMEIRYLKFTVVGTIATNDVQNIRLELAGTEIAQIDGLNSDKTAIFDLSDSPITIGSGQTKQLALRGDMHGGAGRTFKFTIQRSGDVMLYDTNYGVYVTPNITSPTTAFGIVQPTTGNGTTVDSGTLTVGVAADSPTGNIPDGATGVTFAKFSFYAAGEDVKVSDLSIKATGTGSDEVLANVKMLLDGSQVGTTVSTLTANNTATADFTFGNTFVVSAGKTSYVTIVADTTGNNIAAGDTLSVNLVAGSGNATGQVTLTSISTTAQTARTLTVQSGTASVVKNTAFSDRSSTNPNGTVSASDVKIGSFIITAGAGEAINVTQIGLKDDATTQLGDNFQNLKIKNSSGVQIGSTVASLNTTAGTYSFTPSSAIKIAAGQQYVVDVYADVKSSVADSATDLSPVCAFDSITATGDLTGTDASFTTDRNLQTAHIAAQGNLTITKDNDSPVSQLTVMGATDTELVKFKFAADAAEDINISKLVVNNLSSAAATGTIKNLKLFVDGEQVGQTVNFTGEYASTTYAVFDGLELTIPRNNNKVVTVKGDINSYDNGAASASTHELSIYPLYDGTNEPVSGVGASSGASITAGYLDIGGTTDVQVRGNQFGVYRTYITVAWADDTPSGASVGGAARTVAKINITNSANVGNYDTTIKALNFTIGQTGISLTADRQLKIYKDSISVGNLLATTQWIGSATENFGDTAITDAGMTNVAISPNSTKLFIVTMDTQDAGSDDKLDLNVGSTDVLWNDGVNNATAVNSLPLSPKTLTY